MKKIVLALSIGTLAIMAFVFFAVSANATDWPLRFGKRINTSRRVFNPDNELSKSKCANAQGNPVINVTQRVRNDADSGESGNRWAFDYYTRTIRVWQTGDNAFCAVLAYNGEYFAVPGQVGPGNEPVGALIDSPVNGRMSGGMRITITGTLLASPAWSTNGNVGVTNYQCNINGDCPGLVNWRDKYFEPGHAIVFDWWGWKYTSGGHGTWINQCGSDIPSNPNCTGNSGNIL